MELVERKAEVRWLYAHFLVSQRRICELLGVAESSQRYVSRRNDEELRTRLVEKTRYGNPWKTGFPQRLEISQKQRDFHFPTASATTISLLTQKSAQETSYDSVREARG